MKVASESTISLPWLPTLLRTQRNTTDLWDKKKRGVRDLIERMSEEGDAFMILSCSNRRHDCESVIIKILE